MESIYIYKSTDTINSYLDRIREYELELEKENYNIVHKFINSLFAIKSKSFTEIKPISIDRLNIDKTHVADLILQNRDNFVKLLKMPLEDIMVMIDNSDINMDDYIDNNKERIFLIYFIKRILDSIGFSFVYKSVNEKPHYIIRHKEEKYCHPIDEMKYEDVIKKYTT
jgi:hypothetical protein